MLSQNVSKATVPSYYMIRTNLPQRKPLNQWEGVYYFSGITKRQQHTILLQRKRERAAQLAAFQGQRQAVQDRYRALGDQTLGGAQVPLVGQLATHGLYREASQMLEELHHARQLRVDHYVALLRTLAAERLQQCVLHTEAGGDPSLVFKLLGDYAGEERAAEAYRWHDMGMAVLRAESSVKGQRAEGTAAAAQLTNALMETLLTCGYTHVKAVPSSLYDRMGAAGVSPTMRTYELVMLALSLEGNTAEAESIHRFLRERHGEHLTVGSFNALLLGHREDRAYDRCDALWQELVDLRWPRANVLTAELYLRSIIDHSYTPTSGPLQRFGNLSTVEKKKVPLVLAQMADMGIPRTHLSRALTDEVEDALRKFSLYRDRFYQWGRAVKQFDFIEFRRRNGWMYDLHLMSTATHQATVARDPTNPNATVAAAGTMELPAFFSEKPSWERQALEGVLFTTDRKERTEDVRAGDFYYDDVRSVQARSSTWMNQVPETRYDQLYGVGHPDIAKVGIRRHLDVEYVNRQEVLDRDAALLRKSVSGGRRLRQRVEGARTHRNEGTLAKGRKK